jgi:small subunit ribosomal protein S16
VLMIRLARVGARKQPHYRVVVIEKERARNGRPVEIVGTYNPRTNPASVELKRERIDYWRSKGAQVSERVGKILGFATTTTAPAEPVASSVLSREVAACESPAWKCRISAGQRLSPAGTAPNYHRRTRASAPHEIKHD